MRQVTQSANGSRDGCALRVGSVVTPLTLVHCVFSSLLLMIKWEQPGWTQHHFKEGEEPDSHRNSNRGDIQRQLSWRYSKAIGTGMLEMCPSRNWDSRAVCAEGEGSLR